MKFIDLFKKTPKKNRWAETETMINKEIEEKRTFNKKLYDLVYDYPTKHKEGFISSEQQELLKQFPEINMEKFSDALCGITCMMDEETGGFIIYHCDILTALRCGLENRNINSYEWD
jgi:hypothetical protein